mgnify:CR=1 FL=1
MRTSKNRSRSKSNRNNNNNRSNVNIVNRVFDSSGPEGKVRGTPQQIIEKYTQLARDAQLAHDRVATENFQQHAEHYTRLLGKAVREQEARREQQEAQHRERQQNREDNRAQHNQNKSDDVASAGSDQPQPNPQPQHKPRENHDAQPNPVAAAGAEQPDVMGLGDQPDLGLVETPESKPARKPARKPRAPRKKPVVDEALAPEAVVAAAPEEAAE